MKLLRELELNAIPPRYYLGFDHAAIVVDQSRKLLESEISAGRLRAFHPLPGFRCILFKDLADWFEYTSVPPGHRDFSLYFRRCSIPQNADALDFHQKEFARTLCTYAIKIGLLERGRCLYCGKERGHAHHPDYAKPLQVQWLCKSHHIAHHQRLRSAEKKLRETNRPAQFEIFPEYCFRPLNEQEATR